MVLKCMLYITHITLNVSQTGCTVVTQLGFELGLLVWQAGSLPTKLSGLAANISTATVGGVTQEQQRESKSI